MHPIAKDAISQLRAGESLEAIICTLKRWSSERRIFSDLAAQSLRLRNQGESELAEQLTQLARLGVAASTKPKKAHHADTLVARPMTRAGLSIPGAGVRLRRVP